MMTRQVYHKDTKTQRKRQVDLIDDSFVFTFTLSLFYIAVFSMLISCAIIIKFLFKFFIIITWMLRNDNIICERDLVF
jgi:hypothetical protein